MSWAVDYDIRLATRTLSQQVDGPVRLKRWTPCHPLRTTPAALGASSGSTNRRSVRCLKTQLGGMAPTPVTTRLNPTRLIAALAFSFSTRPARDLHTTCHPFPSHSSTYPIAHTPATPISPCQYFSFSEPPRLCRSRETPVMQDAGTKRWPGHTGRSYTPALLNQPSRIKLPLFCNPRSSFATAPVATFIPHQLTYTIT